MVQGLRDLAARARVEILIGSALVRGDDGGAPTAPCLIRADGAIAATYDKIHMFDVDLPTGETARESELYTPGDEAVVVDTAAGRLGLTICYDVRFPGLYRALARAGARDHHRARRLHPADRRGALGDPAARPRDRVRRLVIAPAQGGFHADGRGTWGRSMVVGPWGEVVARLDDDEPGRAVRRHRPDRRRPRPAPPSRP